MFVNDVLSLYADATRAGRTSMTIRVRVCTWRKPNTEQMINVTEAEVVLVAIDDKGHPVSLSDN